MRLSRQLVFTVGLPLSIALPALLSLGGLAFDSAGLRLAAAWAALPFAALVLGAILASWRARRALPPAPERQRKAAVLALDALNDPSMLLEAEGPDGTPVTMRREGATLRLCEGAHDRITTDGEALALLSLSRNLKLRRAPGDLAPNRP